METKFLFIKNCIAIKNNNLQLIQKIQRNAILYCRV